MANLDSRVRTFIETWERRKAGELPGVDMRVSCQICGASEIGDNKLKFTQAGLLCKRCLEGKR